MLKNKIALVTGSSRGIGGAIASVLAENGVNTIICARNSALLESKADEIRSRGGSCGFIVTDVSIPEEVEQLGRKIKDTYGRIDILVNNAGVACYKPMVQSSLQDWMTTMNTNLLGAFLCCKEFAPMMAAQREGVIVNIASEAGRKGFKNLSVYCSSKSGLIGLSQSIRDELRPFGIRVHYICPGFVKTDFFRNFPSEFRLPSNAGDPISVAFEVLAIINGKSYPSRLAARLAHKLKILARSWR